MLNIPASVKALFQTDGVHKNFRVHFPNNELPDITNENIVSESVNYTESLCSQNNFKFGLAEASVLEFETVGIGNMYGMIIEAGIEIDASSLSAAEISVIEAGTWDGTLVKSNNKFNGAAVISTNSTAWDVTWSNDTLSVKRKTASFADKPYFNLNLSPGTYVFWYNAGASSVSAVASTLMKDGATAKVLQNGDTFTIEAGYSYRIDFSSNQNTASVFNEIMIEAGSTPTSYDQYVDGVCFRVPYGMFRVENCPRNHGALAHRKVTAYSLTTQMITHTQSDFEKDKAEYWFSNDQDRIDVFTLLSSKIGYVFPEFLAEHYTKTLLFSSDNMTQSSFSDRVGTTVNNARLRLTMTTIAYSVSASPVYRPAKNELWEVNVGDFDYSGAQAFIDSAKETYGADIDIVTNPIGYFSKWCSAQIQIGTNALVQDDNNIAIVGSNFITDQSVIYPHNGGRDSDGAIGVRFPIYAKLELLVNGSVTETFTTTATTLPTIYKYVASTVFPSITIDAIPTAEMDIVVGENTRTVYRYNYNELYTKLLTSAVEIWGRFAKQTKDAMGLEYVQLDNSAPISITPGSYMEMWWDEFNIAPIGSVLVTYQDTDDNGKIVENYASISVGTGISRYNMSDNEGLKNLANAKLANVAALISSYFAPSIGAVAFTPIELTMHGWPWLEAGDALQITAEDNTTVNSYALRIELSGIQYLQAVITSAGGKIIEEVT